jgi:hypothetical protein
MTVRPDGLGARAGRLRALHRRAERRAARRAW